MKRVYKMYLPRELAARVLARFDFKIEPAQAAIVAAVEARFPPYPDSRRD